MAGPDRIFRALVAGGGPIAFRDFERILVAFGFRLDRIKGSHRIYVHQRIPRPLSVQPRGNEAKPYQVRQFLDMVEEYGLRLER